MVEQNFNRTTLILSFGVVTLTAWILAVFFWPNHYEPFNTLVLDKPLNVPLLDTKNSPPLATRTGLFKPATPLRDKPVADKTIERIRSKLKLQCIMEINHEPTAYILIDGSGLKQCRPGQTIHDLFTVLAIHQDRVDVSIVDHKVTLRM